MTMIARLASSGDITILLVEQQIECATDFADRVVVMERGREAWLGPSADLHADRAVVGRLLLDVGIH